MSYQLLIDDEENWNERSIDADISKEVFELKKEELPSDRERVYNDILYNGPTTLKEMSERWGCPPNCISGRFSELKKAGLITAVGKRLLPNYKGKMYPHTVWGASR